MSEVSLQHIEKVYPHSEKKKSNLKVTDEGVLAVQDFNLNISDREFIVLVGPSGCGKSTTLRMVAGLEEITRGELYIDGKLVNDVEPKDRDIAMVFQSYQYHYRLYKWLESFDSLMNLPCFYLEATSAQWLCAEDHF